MATGRIIVDKQETPIRSLLFLPHSWNRRISLYYVLHVYDLIALLRREDSCNDRNDKNVVVDLFTEVFVCKHALYLCLFLNQNLTKRDRWVYLPLVALLWQKSKNKFGFFFMTLKICHYYSHTLIWKINWYLQSFTIFHLIIFCKCPFQGKLSY